MKEHEPSEIQRLIEEKAKKAARQEAGRIALIFMTPLSLIAIVVSLSLPGTQGPLLTVLLFAVLVVILFVANDTLYAKYYKRFLEELSSSKKEER